MVPRPGIKGPFRTFQQRPTCPAPYNTIEGGRGRGGGGDVIISNIRYIFYISTTPEVAHSTYCTVGLAR